MTETFDRDLKDLHLIYDYDAQDAQGNPEKWRYEMWFFSHDRIVYAIHGGPMAGRYNYQTATYQCIRPGELWQCNWLEETGTICSLVYDIPKGTITTLLAFSKGHWEQAEKAHGDKRNEHDFERWRGLAKIGSSQTDRKLLSEQAKILEKFHGKVDTAGNKALGGWMIADGTEDSFQKQFGTWPWWKGSPKVKMVKMPDDCTGAGANWAFWCSKSGEEVDDSLVVTAFP